MTILRGLESIEFIEVFTGVPIIVNASLPSDFELHIADVGISSSIYRSRIDYQIRCHDHD